MANVRESLRDPIDNVDVDDSLRKSHGGPIPRLLVSARNSAEAYAAIAGGADIIDLKEPARGSLGPVERKVAVDVADGLGRRDSRLPLSLAMGELANATDRHGFAALRTAMRDFGFAKVGLAGTSNMPDWQTAWCDWCDRLPTHVDAVFVMYVDWQSAETRPPLELLRFAAMSAGERRAKGVLFDTWQKCSGDLFSAIPVATLGGLVSQARDAGLWTALAGSLNAQTVAKAMFMRPDIIAVRGAACSGGRDGTVQSRAVLKFRAAMVEAARQPQKI